MDNNSPAPIANLPQEMIARIVNHVGSSSDIRRLTRVCAATRLYANMRIWKTCHARKLQELSLYPRLEQQHFANFVQIMYWEVTWHHTYDLSYLQFPSLRVLTIRHHESDVAIRLNQFIQPALEHVTIMEHGTSAGTSNYIPLLVNCPALRTLWIEIDPQASDAEFLTAVTACRQLEVLNLTGPVCQVLNSRIFQYLACQSRLEKLSSIDAGFRMTQDLIQPTIATLGTGETVFNHLTTLSTGMDGAAAEELFPLMPSIRTLMLYIDESDDIIQCLRLLPHLYHLSLIARADVSLTPRYLRGLQYLSLISLEISGQDGFEFNGVTISPDHIDTLFGSHDMLVDLKVGWRGDEATPSFVQSRPHLLIERILAHYPGLDSLVMPTPCGAVDFRRLPMAPLNSSVRYLEVENIVGPGIDRDAHPVEYHDRTLRIACGLIKHFPRLSVMEANQDVELAEDVLRDYRTMKRAGL